MNYRQIGNACGAYSLSLVHQLVHGAESAPPECEWHAKAVGKAYSEYCLLPHSPEQAKPSPDGLYGKVVYSADDGPDNQMFKIHLLAKEYSNPIKMVNVFNANCENRWHAQLCYSEKYPETGLALVKQFLQGLLDLLEFKRSKPDPGEDILTRIKDAKTESYASIVLISFYAGESSPEISGLHFVTVRKAGNGELEVYDSNSEKFTWYGDVKEPYEKGGHASPPIKLNALKLGDAFKMCGIIYNYIGFGVLYSKI